MRSRLHTLQHRSQSCVCVEFSQVCLFLFSSIAPPPSVNSRDRCASKTSLLTLNLEMPCVKNAIKQRDMQEPHWLRIGHIKAFLYRRIPRREFILETCIDWLVQSGPKGGVVLASIKSPGPSTTLLIGLNLIQQCNVFQLNLQSLSGNNNHSKHS